MSDQRRNVSSDVGITQPKAPPVLDYQTPEQPLEYVPLPLEPDDGVRIPESGCLALMLGMAICFLVAAGLSMFASEKVAFAVATIVLLTGCWWGVPVLRHWIVHSRAVGISRWLTSWLLLCVLLLVPYRVFMERHGLGVPPAVQYAGAIAVISVVGWLTWRERY